MIAATFPTEKTRADELNEQREEVAVELDSESRREVRIATLARILRSMPGLWVYKVSQWPLFPYLTGATAAFIGVLAKSRVQKYLEAKSEAKVET
jgi:hypothetical protein